MSNEPMTARHLIIHGQVQGVFYRDWTVEAARNLDIVGWVRNLSDGPVEAHLEGAPEAVDRMIVAMHDGPPRAAVDHIDIADAQPQALTDFTRR